jgi:hypothetical protein
MNDLQAGFIAGRSSHVPNGDAPTDSSETIYVNVREPSGPPSGVLLYYAVLAYPRIEESRKRREFVESLAAMRFREFLVNGAKREDIPIHFRRYKREKMLSRNTLGWKRVERRIQAGIMGWCIFLNEKHHSYATPTPDGKVGVVFRGPNTVNDCVRAFVASRQSGADQVHLELESAHANVTHRIWAESLPVLHIAMENPVTIKIVEEQVKTGLPTGQQIARDIFDSVHDPSWLRQAIEDAENLKSELPERLGTDPNDPRGLGFRSEKAISLIPTEDPALSHRL